MPSAKFLQITAHPQGDGAVGLPPVRLMRQQAALVEKGWETETISFIRLQAPPTGFIRRALAFRRMVKAMVARGLETRSDIMIAHDIETLPAGRRIARALGVPLIYDSHENWPALISHNSKLESIAASVIETRNVLGAAHVFVTSESTAARFKRLGLPTTVLYNGHADSDVVLTPRLPARTGLGYSPSDFVMGFIGNLHEITTKGDIVLTLFEAMTRLPERVKLLIVGGPDHISDALAKLATEMGIGNRVHVLHHMPYKNLSPYYAALDLGLVLLRPLPSYVDALPWKFFDYMAYGVPVLAPNFKDMGGIVRVWECGWTYDREEELLDVLKTIESTDSFFLDAMSECGREAFLSKFCWETQAARFVEICESYT